MLHVPPALVPGEEQEGLSLSGGQGAPWVPQHRDLQPQAPEPLLALFPLYIMALWLQKN